MECSKCCGYIQPFLNNELDYKDKRIVLKHISKCEKCKKELRTCFLVVEGMKRLESGNDFNLISDFEIMYENEISEISSIHKERIFLYILTGSIYLLTIAILFFSLFNK